MDYAFYGITMKTKKGQTLYLKCSSREVKGDPYKVLFDWTFNVEEACLWESDDECERSAKDYFKKFNNYEVRQININPISLKTYLVKEVA